MCRPCEATRTARAGQPARRPGSQAAPLGPSSLGSFPASWRIKKSREAGKPRSRCASKRFLNYLMSACLEAFAPFVSKHSLLAKISRRLRRTARADPGTSSPAASMPPPGLTHVAKRLAPRRLGASPCRRGRRARPASPCRRGRRARRRTWTRRRGSQSRAATS